MTSADLSDAIELLRSFGFAALVDELLDPTNYTRTTARLNHTRVCRKLGWSAHQLRHALEKCRELLADLADE